MKTTERFSDRVDDYVKYRPSYPPEVIATLERDLGLTPDVPVADIGSGTGIMTRLLLDRGYEVFAVEPNEPMRRAAERESHANARFHSVDGTAEATTLPSGSVGMVMAAQAFHWFDFARARVEMQRILREPGLVALVWNDRRMKGPFLEAYERALNELSVDYGNVRHQDTASHEKIVSFFGSAPRTYAFPYEHRLDRAGLIGRVMSASYAPKPGHPHHEPLMESLEALWQEHGEKTGSVVFEYDTRLFVGTLA